MKRIAVCCLAILPTLLWLGCTPITDDFGPPLIVRNKYARTVLLTQEIQNAERRLTSVESGEEGFITAGRANTGGCLQGDIVARTSGGREVGRLQGPACSGESYVLTADGTFLQTQ